MSVIKRQLLEKDNRKIMIEVFSTTSTMGVDFTSAIFGELGDEVDSVVWLTLDAANKDFDRMVKEWQEKGFSIVNED